MDAYLLDKIIRHVVGWLFYIKYSQIRDCLHVLGTPPTGQSRVDLVLAMLRARQIWGGSVALPGLREALGLPEGASRTDTDAVERTAAALVAGMEQCGWRPEAVTAVVEEALGRSDDAVAAVLRFAAA